MRSHSCSILLAVCLLLGGCSSEQESLSKGAQGAAAGAAIGAGLGAIVGSQTGSTGAGVAIGSAFGALSGGVIGRRFDEEDRRIAARGRSIEQQEEYLAENRKLIDEFRALGVETRTSSRGVVVDLPDVFFEFGSAQLSSPARLVVRDIAGVLRTAKGRPLAIEGHTDSVGDDKYNERLSLRRAMSVENALAMSGIPRSAMTAKGFGARTPVASNDTPAGRRKNRRVEVIIEGH